MSDDDNGNANNDLVENISNAAVALGNGLPLQVQKSLWKAVGRVIIAGAEWPAAYLEGKGSVSKARAEARVKSIAAKQQVQDYLYEQAAKAGGALFNDPLHAKRAFDSFTRDILEEQATKEEILKVAFDEIRRSPPQNDSSNTIDEDILKAILKEGGKRSTEEFKNLFGKILAGEIKQPGTFSMKTIQCLAQMSSRTAYVFQLACNVSSSGIIDTKIIQEPFGQASNNDLDEFGLNYGQLMILVEEGLLRPSFSEWQEMYIWVHKTRLPFEHGNKTYYFEPKDQPPEGTKLLNIRVSGPSFTNVGQQMKEIVTIEESSSYFGKLKAWFEQQGFSMIEYPP